MTGLSMGAAAAIADKFPWDRYHTVIDIGAAEGCVPAQLAVRYPHLSGGGFDLPATGPIFEEYVAAHGPTGRLRFYPGDFFADPMPSADVLVMGHILHDWSLAEKLTLIRKAYQALPDGGALIVYDAMIDDDRRANTFGLLMSVNMLIETQAGLRLHRRRLPLVDGRHRIPRQLRRTAHRARLDGRRHQIAHNRPPAALRYNATSGGAGQTGGRGRARLPLEARDVIDAIRLVSRWCPADRSLT